MPWLTQTPHARWLEGETDRLLDFGRAARLSSGGFGWLDDDGTLDPEHVAELWITCRMTHVFALASLLGRPGFAELVDHGLAALDGPFADGQHGGWHARLDHAGAGELGPKEAYGHAFVVLAASSAAVAGRPAAGRALERALAVQDDHWWDDDAGMVVDTYDPTFAVRDPYRGVNSSMHTVEAYLAASDATGAAVWRQRALRIIERVVGFAQANQWRLPEHYTDHWHPLLDYGADSPEDQFRPYGSTIGHGLEWSRLIAEAAAALGPNAPGWLMEAAVKLFDRAAGDGWAVDGAPGFVYTVDWTGQPVVSGRLHWVAAEAVGAAATLYRATGLARYARDYETWWEYIASHVIDRRRGSWRHELDASNRPAASVWAGKPDIYHAIQATLIPRLPLAPSLASAIGTGLLDS